MEMEEIHSQARKRWRTENGRSSEEKLGQKIGDPYQDEDDDEGEGEDEEEKGRILAWHSSRIFRVSRASGGKDRHSKVLTAKGLRDRRVRLSVSTAIQFYDLQDRLGYDQPSKAVEWLIKKAADAIAELPSLDGAFPSTPKQATDGKRFETGYKPGGDLQDHLQQQHLQQQQQQQQLLSLSKSACSSTSETSKGSVLSLSRSEIRVKARERARERAAKEKEKEKERENDSHFMHHQNRNPTPQSSFTELLTGGSNNNNNPSNISAAQHGPNLNLVHKQFRDFPSMDCFGQVMLGPAVSKPQQPTGFSGQTHLGNTSLSGMPVNINTTTGDNSSEMQQFSFLPDHFIPVAAVPTNDYNLNFSISSSLPGFNRGTLQSNSAYSLPHLQRFPSPVDGSSVPFFIGPAGTESQFPAGFDARLQLYYGDGCRHPDLKGKGKN